MLKTKNQTVPVVRVAPSYLMKWQLEDAAHWYWTQCKMCSFKIKEINKKYMGILGRIWGKKEKWRIHDLPSHLSNTIWKSVSDSEMKTSES